LEGVLNRLLKNNALIEKLHRLRFMAADHILIIRILALAAVYFVIARFGFTFAPGEQVTVIWPAAGVSLASVLLFGYRVWPGIFLGSFLSKMSVHLPVLTGLGVASCNTLEPLIGAWLLHYYVGAGHYLKSLKGIFGLWFFGAFISTAICAAIGMTVLCLSGLQTWATYEPEFLTWWLADAGGALIITPVLLAWGCGSYSMPSPRTIIEAVVLFVVAITVGIIIFIHPAAMGAVRIYPHMIFPLLTWAAIRFGERMVTLMILAVCSAALWTATHHTGFFAPNVFYLANLPISQALILAQTYTMVVAVIGLTIYAAISELREAERQSQENLQYLQEVIDHIPDPLLIKNRQYVLTGGNKALWEILNGSPEELIGSTCDDLFLNKEEAQSFNEKYDQVFGTGDTSVSEEVFTDHTGKRHILSLKRIHRTSKVKTVNLMILPTLPRMI
jgi:integral membrane sensor domain MASE1